MKEKASRGILSLQVQSISIPPNTLALATMIDLMKINEQSFKRCVCFDSLNCSVIAKLHALDTDLASAKECTACLNSLIQRLCLEKIEWLEQALVTRLYIIVKYPMLQDAEGAKNLRKLLDGVFRFSGCAYSTIRSRQEHSLPAF